MYLFRCCKSVSEKKSVNADDPKDKEARCPICLGLHKLNFSLQKIKFEIMKKKIHNTLPLE